MKHGTPKPFTDDDSTACVTVALFNSPQHWITTAAAYSELVHAGLSGKFWLSHEEHGGYVTGHLGIYGGQVIARLIAHAGIGLQVTYRDGNRLNLRPDNLVLEECAHVRSPSDVILQIAQASYQPSEVPGVA